jgi:hypothetical protein
MSNKSKKGEIRVMNRNSTRIMLLVLLLALLTGCMGGAVDGDSKLINQTIDTFIKARLDNNATLLASVLTDDVWHNPDWYTREEYVKEVTEEWLRWDRFRIENRDITYGEEMAVVESKWSYRFTGDDEYFALGLPVTIRLYKQNGKWLINGIY